MTVRLTHIGGPTVLVEAHGWRILSDPTFDPPGRRYSFGWGTSSTKTAGPAVAVADLPPLDLVLLSHDHHADNLDDAGRALLPGARSVVTTPSGARRLTASNVQGVAAWETTAVSAPGLPDLTITATPCRHGPPLSRPIAGEVVGFALQWVDDPAVVWISGDTVLYDGVREVAERLDVDVAVLHLGSVRFGLTGPLRYSMSGRDAIELADLIRPRIAVPVHFEGWSHFSEQENALHDVLDPVSGDVPSHFRWLTRGVPLEV
ncbi:MBL fold metallo-hydrolase [Nocardioides sp. URHA0020]|uniref:MBL fold metallo-hydrolase n=1 Tax=Nocardioides sp. URHA0020 TaxID=1380392 RepID=UPI00056717DF|nr:MBL fold metallo-hydrolase [Nocardioides sp. URHA0020]